jgi:hypothetical protein
MSDIINISEHSKFEGKDPRTDKLFFDIMQLIVKNFKEDSITPTEAVGTLEWIKSCIIIMNTDYTGD